MALKEDSRGGIPVRKSVGIVGGGIAGLYCARELAKDRSYVVSVYETRDQWGGRIETVLLDGYPAEFGPMRFEPPLQTSLTDLCRELGFSDPDDATEDENGPGDWKTFPAPKSDRIYRTFRSGVFAMFGKAPDDTAWLGDLFDGSDAGLDRLRQSATLKGRSDQNAPRLYDMGFWNALSEVLPHKSVLEIRDRGHFYHLIPDNPNAVEWGIFWLRYFYLKRGQTLHSMRGGVRRITDSIIQELRLKDNVVLALGQEIVSVTHGKDPYSVSLKVNCRKSGRSYEVEHDHVILALPKSPLLKLADSAPFPDHIQRHLHAVIGFPLLKIFAVLDHPAWQGGIRLPKAQTGAEDIPTREVHYWPYGESKAVVLLYTDHPASEYWKWLVDGKVHEKTETAVSEYLIRTFAEHLVRANVLVPDAESPDEPAPQRSPRNTTLVMAFARTFAEGAHATSDQGLKARLTTGAEALQNSEHDPTAAAKTLKRLVTACGIRDWSRAPFGAGCHAWKPRVKSWIVRRDLAEFGLIGRSGIKNLHVCGEAYSDYQGFIEGALRSAKLTVNSVRAGDFSTSGSSRPQTPTD
jgi:hypothetical protein